MASKKREYTDPENWEYDFGSANWTGDTNNLPLYIKELSDRLTKEAFPDGVEAFQKQRAAAGEKIVITLDKGNYPLLLRHYGTEGAKRQAIAMCQKAGRAITAENIEGILTNMEEALEEMFEGSVDDPQ